MKSSQNALCLEIMELDSPVFAEYTCSELKLVDCPNQKDNKLPDPHDMLTWNQEQRLVGFRNTYRSYDGSAFYANKKNILKLPKYKKTINNQNISFSLDNQTYHLNDYLKSQDVAGLMILKNGQIAYEYYKADNDDSTLWTSRSIAKSIVATLVGVAIKQGKITSLEDPIIKYLPDLKDTAWDKVTLRQLMQHTSGVEWDEDYTNPQSDFSQMTYCEVKDDPDACVYDLVKHAVTAQTL